MNKESLSSFWRSTFYSILRSDPNSAILKQASLDEDLETWTKELTVIVIKTCTQMGWQCAAKNNKSSALPIRRNEYLSIDVMAFPEKESRWKFPVAVFELENQQKDEFIEYAFWKTICVRADLRVLFCYRKTPDEGARLVTKLNREVLDALQPEDKLNVEGETIICIGNRQHAGTFPYDFFRWWHLDKNLGKMTKMS
jgi:hypothetical protein